MYSKGAIHSPLRSKLRLVGTHPLVIGVSLTHDMTDGRKIQLLITQVIATAASRHLHASCPCPVALVTQFSICQFDSHD